MGSIEGLKGSETICLPTATEENVLDILVENMGRVNYGQQMNEQRKGMKQFAMGHTKCQF